MLGYDQQAGGTHPTGMHSCSTSIYNQFTAIKGEQKYQHYQLCVLRKNSNGIHESNENQSGRLRSKYKQPVPVAKEKWQQGVTALLSPVCDRSFHQHVTLINTGSHQTKTNAKVKAKKLE